MPHIFGILTGAYVFQDGYNVEVPNNPYYYKNVGQAGGFALWAGLKDYRVPAAIHDFMLHKYDGWWARLQSRYTLNHYPMHTDGPEFFGFTAEDPDDSPPKYFNANGSIFMDARFRSVTQLYFVTDDYLNSSGGYFRKYYEASILGIDISRGIGV